MRIDRGETVTRRSNRAGFTIVEVVVSLAVLSVATYIAVSLYSSGYSFAEAGRNTGIAVELAETRLAELSATPAAFTWPSLGAGEFAEITPTDPNSASYVPDVLPTDRRFGLRARNTYEQFTVRSFGRLPEEQAAYAEVVILVSWENQGRERHYTLTSVLPRAAWGGGA